MLIEWILGSSFRFEWSERRTLRTREIDKYKSETSIEIFFRSFKVGVSEWVRYRFEESEYKLHEEIKRCSVFSTETKCYPLLVKLNFIDTLLFLLGHDNILIVIESTKLLWELSWVSEYREELSDDRSVVNDVNGDAMKLVESVVSVEGVVEE